MLRLFLSLFAIVAASMSHAREYVALVGTYTGGESRGIYVVRLDGETGAVSQPELAAELSNPEFLALHPNGRFVYALTQVAMADGKNSGAVAAFEVDPANGRLTPLNVEATGQGSLTHLAVDASGRMVIAASYGAGYVVSFPIANDGRVGPKTSLISQTGPLGPNSGRQDKPHPHSVTLSPDSRLAFVADLGVDRVFAYRLKPEDGSIAPHDPAYVTIEPGAGPRHTAFSPDASSFYVLNELVGTVSAFRYDAARGAAEFLHNASASPEGYTGRNSASEIRMHPTGRFVYAANRGHNGIAVYSRSPDTGALTPVEIIPTGGENPRNFALTPDGEWLLCAHQNTNNLTVFKVDAATGRLTATKHTALVPKGVCVLFLR